MFCPTCNRECEPHARFCSHCGSPLTAVPRERKGSHWVPILAMVLIFLFGTSLFFAIPSVPSESSIPAADDPRWFSLKDGVLYFNEADYDGTGELIIPDTIGGVTVTAISDGCFKNCTGLSSVIIPSTVHAIGEDAFKGCSSLRGIEIPESVLLIGKGAFSGCTSLEAVCVYDGLQSIGSGAFDGCSKLFYIYYSGYFAQWDELYGEFINPYTTVFSQDGSFYQGDSPN